MWGVVAAISLEIPERNEMYLKFQILNTYFLLMLDENSWQMHCHDQSVSMGGILGNYI